MKRRRGGSPRSAVATVTAAASSSTPVTGTVSTRSNITSTAGPRRAWGAGSVAASSACQGRARLALAEEAQRDVPPIGVHEADAPPVLAAEGHQLDDHVLRRPDGHEQPRHGRESTARPSKRFGAFECLLARATGGKHSDVPTKHSDGGQSGGPRRAASVTARARARVVAGHPGVAGGDADDAGVPQVAVGLMARHTAPPPEGRDRATTSTDVIMHQNGRHPEQHDDHDHSGRSYGWRSAPGHGQVQSPAAASTRTVNVTAAPRAIAAPIGPPARRTTSRTTAPTRAARA